MEKPANPTPEARIDQLLPILDEMVGDGLVTVERAHIITYRGSPPTA